MKIVCSRESLLNAFTTASSVIKANNAKEILRNIKIEASNDETVLQASDLEIRIRIKVANVEVNEPGEAILPTTLVRQVLNESKAETVRIEVDGSNLIFNSGGSKFKFPTEDPNEFPPVLPFKSDKYITFNGAEFVKAINQTAFASDPMSGRAVFGGVLCSIENNIAHFVATDTRRMSHASISTGVVGDIDVSKPISAIVPKATMLLAERVFANTEGEIKALFENNLRVTFSSESITMYAQLIEGVYPNWQSIFQKNVVYEIPVIPSELISAVKQASIVSTQEYHGVIFEFQNNVLTLSGHSPEYGDSTIPMNIDFPHEEMFRTKISPSLITDFLRVLEQGTPCALQLINGNNPILFRPNENLEYAVMPLSLAK